MNQWESQPWNSTLKTQFLRIPRWKIKRGELVEVKYEAMEEKDALSVKVEHREEPPMKEGEEFATVVEYWVTRSPTKLLAPDSPKPPTLPKPSDPSEIGCLHPLN